jgi:hypothetical protein
MSPAPALLDLPLCDVLSDEQLAAADLPVVDIPLVSVGGGLGSFALVDMLRVAGTPATRIRVVSPESVPGATFLRRCRDSGLADTDLLRSDSSARIDNVWGFPGYAVEQAWRSRRLGPLWRVLTEPVFTEYYTPSVGLVRAGLCREAARVGWPTLLVDGTATAIRPRVGGGYFVLVEPSANGCPFAYRCDFVHLALGHPELRHSEDAWLFHDRNPADARVVHVYQPHEHVYTELVRRGGAVLVRGSGIAASRVLQRLIDDRDRSGRDVRIWQQFRQFHVVDTGPIWFRRQASAGLRQQPFNFPKAAAGGQLRDRTLRLSDAARAELIRAMGGTTTPYRRLWADQLRRGRAEGWYRAVVGALAGLSGDARGVIGRIQPRSGDPVEVRVDFVVDATGLDTDIRRHPLLADLVLRVGAGTNPLGGLDVGPDFEVRGTASGAGRIYASGVLAAGGYLGPADSFAGLQQAAVIIADSLAERGFGCRFSTGRSALGWWRWMRNKAP